MPTLLERNRARIEKVRQELLSKRKPKAPRRQQPTAVSGYPDIREFWYDLRMKGNLTWIQIAQTLTAQELHLRPDAIRKRVERYAADHDLPAPGKYERPDNRAR